MTTAAAADKIHKFEAAGLGLAPFRFIGIETAAARAAVQSERAGDGMTYTTNYSTSCDYCGQGIQNAYQVESFDGKRFKVGCDCIRKTGDAGLIRCVSEEETGNRRAATAKRRQSKIEREHELLAKFFGGQCESLKGLPHPKGRADSTAYGYVEWCIVNKMYGEAVLKMIENA